MLLLKNLLLTVNARYAYGTFLHERATTISDRYTTARWLDVVCHTWTLADNLLSIYETLANKINIAQESQRQQIQARLGGRTSTPRLRFHKTVWLYSILTMIPDDALMRAGIDPTNAKRILDTLIKRSLTRLQADFETIATYHKTYAGIAASYKHGRATYPLTITLTDLDPDGIRHLNLEHDASRISILQPKRDGAITISELTIDQATRDDVDRVRRVAANQLPRLLTFAIETAATTIEWIKRLDAGDLTGRMPGFRFSFFAEPYTPEEEDVITRLGALG
jgi:hypothetical protein